MTRPIPRYPMTQNPGQYGARIQWPAEATALAVSMWPTTPSAAHVADEINARFGLSISRKSVISKMHRMGLSFRGPVLPEMLPPGTKGQARPDRVRTTAPKARSAPKPRPVPVLVAQKPRPAPRPSALPESRRVAIEDLRYGQCRYIAGDPRVDSTCCGHAAEVGSAWCPGHARLCTTESRPRVSAGFMTYRRAA